MRLVFATATAAILGAHVPTTGMAAQVALELTAGAAVPVGRLAEFQDRGTSLSLAVEPRIHSNWAIRGVIGRASFRADPRQHPLFAGGPWLPVEMEIWTGGVQLVRAAERNRTAVRPSLLLGADLLRTSRLYDWELGSPAPMREIYPAIGVGLRLTHQMRSRLDVLGDVRGHVTLTSAEDSELVLRSAGVHPNAGGARLFAHIPIVLGVRLKL